MSENFKPYNLEEAQEEADKMREKIKSGEDNEPYWAEEMFPASKEGFIDAIKETEWFSKNVKNFSDEFDWWLNREEV